jgi:hypothetical protein
VCRRDRGVSTAGRHGHHRRRPPRHNADAEPVAVRVVLDLARPRGVVRVLAEFGGDGVNIADAEVRQRVGAGPPVQGRYTALRVGLWSAHDAGRCLAGKYLQGYLTPFSKPPYAREQETPGGI